MVFPNRLSILLAGFLYVLIPLESLGQLPAYLIKVRPLNLLSPSRSVFNTGVSARLGQHQYVEAGFGFFVGSEQFARFRDETYRGPQLYASFQRRLNLREPGSAPVFLGVLSEWDAVRNLNYRLISRQGGQYVEQFLIDRRLRGFRVGAYFSYFAYISANKRWLIEPSVGLVTERYEVSYRNFPKDAALLENLRFFSLEYPEGIKRRVFPIIRVRLAFVL